MARRRHEEPNSVEREAISRELLRSIAELEPYADADPAQVEERLRNMNFGATNTRVSKIRRGEPDPAANTE